MADRQRKTEYLLTALPVLVILAYFAVFCLIDFRGFPRIATADMYEDTLAARLMWEGKTLFPQNYLFGNQLYVVATPVLSALFYGLTGSMNLAMALATVCMSLFLILSMGWMLRPFVRQASVRAGALLAFLAVFYGQNAVSREDGQQLFFALCSFYACYLICFFLVLGDYARARENAGRRVPALVLSLLLCFSTGIQSLRQTCVLILPLLLFEGLGVLRRLLRKKPLFPEKRRAASVRVLLYTAANLAGAALSRLLPVHRHTIYTGASVFSGASVGEKLSDLHKALSAVTGLDYTRDGPFRLFCLLMFLLLTGMVLLAALLLLRKASARGSAPAVFWLLAVFGCLAVVAASFLTSVRLRPIYLFLYYILPALSYVLIMAQAGPKQRNALTAVLCLMAAANLYFSYRDDLRLSLDDTPTPVQQISDWAVKEGYQLVYGSHSNAAPYVALQSDGALTAGCWEDEVIFKVSPYINIRDIYYWSDAGRAVFVFLPAELESMRVETEANGTKMTFRGRYGDLSVYTASKQLLYPLTGTMDIRPEYN